MWFRHPFYQLFLQPFIFIRRVFQQFQANQGTLMAGAIAYNALLSLVPLVILLLVALSQFVNEAELLAMLHRYLEQLVPGKSELILGQVQQFLGHRRVLGWTMAGTLLFFSAAAFSVLENAMQVIFAHRYRIHTRRMVTSLLLPYLYVLLLGCGLLTVTLLNSMLQTLATSNVNLFGWQWSPTALLFTTLYIVGLFGQAGVLTLIYMLMPPGRLPWRHALTGGIAAALLWEGTRYILIWYFSNMSKVNAIYGSLAGVIIVLMTLYAISLIILLGAQVIAEYERQLPEFSDAAVK
jgi:YihY family inner membrane protein